MINPYHVQVRKRKPTVSANTSSDTPSPGADDDEGLGDNPPSKEADDDVLPSDASDASDAVLPQTNKAPQEHYVKMSLQLYQVDYKSFLLDFKSVPNVSNPTPQGTVPQSSVAVAAGGEKRNSVPDSAAADQNGKNEADNKDAVDRDADGNKENIDQLTNGDAQKSVNGCDSIENGKGNSNEHQLFINDFVRYCMIYNILIHQIIYHDIHLTNLLFL